MDTKSSWKKFKDAGLLWWINRGLHLFGWAIVMVQEADGTISDVYPAHVDYKGFDRESEERGFDRLTNHIKDNFKS